MPHCQWRRAPVFLSRNLSGARVSALADSREVRPPLFSRFENVASGVSAAICMRRAANHGVRPRRLAAMALSLKHRIEFDRLDEVFESDRKRLPPRSI